MIRRPAPAAKPSSSRSGLRRSRLYWTWLETTGLPSAHARHGRGLGDQRIGPVDLVEVEPVGAQPLQAGVRRHLDPVPGRPDRRDLAGQHDRVPDLWPGQDVAEHPLGLALAVGLGGVDQGDAELPGAVDDRLGLGWAEAVAPAPLRRPELPGPEPDHRRPQPLGLDIAHGFPSPLAWLPPPSCPIATVSNIPRDPGPRSGRPQAERRPA